MVSQWFNLKSVRQALSQDLEIGCPKLAIVRFLGVLYNVMGIILRWKNFNYMLEIYILRNDPQKYLGVLRDDF